MNSLRGVMGSLSELINDSRLHKFISSSSHKYTSFLSLFPAHFFQFSGIEVSIYNSSAHSDLLLELKPSTLSWKYPLRNYGMNIPSKVLEILKYYLLLPQASNPLRNIWLEYDWESFNNKVFTKITPSLFIGSKSNNSKTDDISTLPFHLKKFFSAAPTSCIELILNHAMNTNLFLTQAGYMQGRNIPSTRLVFTSKSMQNIDNFLNRMNMNIFHDENFYSFVNKSQPSLFAIGIDISDDGITSQNYGIEIYKPWNDAYKWRVMIDIVEEHYGQSIKLKALKNVFFENRFFPSIYKNPYSYIEEPHQVLINYSYVSPHHFKFSFSPDCLTSIQPKIKAYIGFLFPHLLRQNNVISLSQAYIPN